MSEKKSPDRWRAAAEALVQTSAHNVHCPDCGRSSLTVRDMEYGYGVEKGVQRYLMCSACGAFNVVSLRRAGSAAA
jgi:transposase-like protein